MERKLAISYIRFSTMAQRDGDSTRRQTEATEAYCKKNGLTLADEYRLKDMGKSAYTGVNRATGALGILEQAVKDGKIPKGTVLIVENLDRLSREDIVTAQLLLLGLINDGIEIVALSDNERRYSKESLAKNPTDLLFSIMVLSRAHEESKTKSYRARESWVNRKKLASQGKHINIKLPSWLDTKNGEYVVNQDKAAIIKKIYALYLQGYGSMSIASILTKQKIPNIAKPVKGRTDRWHPATIQQLLKNKQLIGTYTGTDPETPHFFRAVISDADFYAVQAILKTRYNYKGQNNHNPQPFSHLFTCSRCGQSVVKASSHGYKYLQCSGARIHTCKQTNIAYHPVEAALLKTIYAAGPGVISTDDTAAIDAQKQLDALQGQIAELQNKIDTASALFIATPSEAGTKILQQLEANKISLMSQLEETRNSAFLVDHRADWKEVKARVEVALEKARKIPWEVIPVSVKRTNNRMEFLRHKVTYNPEDALALRETIRRCIDKIVVNIKSKLATISFTSGRTAIVELKHTDTYPRRYSCRHTFDDLATLASATWIPIDLPPRNGS